LFTNFNTEITHIIEILFKQNLKVDKLEYEIKENSDVVIKGDKGSLHLLNTFFNGEYIDLFKRENLPQQLINIKAYGKEISCLYGFNQFWTEEQDIFIGGDIIASTFFLLTQWESTLLKGDTLGRYNYEESTIKRLGIYERPLVNEYVEFLRPLLLQIGIQTEQSYYKPIFTCDVDSITKYSSLRNLIGGFRHRGVSQEIWREYKTSRKDKSMDVYYSFSYLFSMIVQKEIECKFYFMADAENKIIDTMDYDLNEPLMQDLFKQINQMAYGIGLHPSINTWKDKAKMASQKHKLQEAAKSEVTDVRQHYLRYDVSSTFSHMNDIGFKSDSSIQFTEGMGFASGTCTPHKLFDLVNRKQLDIVEIPLVMMKKKDYVKDVESSFRSFKSLIDTCKKYNGEYAILFHNSDLETDKERALFEKVLNYI
jgi:hypothetical protein